MTPKKRKSYSRTRIKRFQGYYNFKLPQVRFSKFNNDWEPLYTYYRRRDLSEK